MKDMDIPIMYPLFVYLQGVKMIMCQEFQVYKSPQERLGVDWIVEVHSNGATEYGRHRSDCISRPKPG